MTMYFIPNLLSFQIYHIVHLYTKLFYKLFFKFTINFYEKLAHVGDEYPWKLIKIIYNDEI